MFHLMNTRWMTRSVLMTVLLMCIGVLNAADLDPNASAETAVLLGDPSKPGLYVILQKWLPHHNSRPHFHPNDRYVTVLSGTWWVNTGPKYDPAGFKPVPAGSFVIHYAKEKHYDGAKDEPCVLQIVGMGPATNTPAEEK